MNDEDPRFTVTRCHPRDEHPSRTRVWLCNFLGLSHGVRRCQLYGLGAECAAAVQNAGHEASPTEPHLVRSLVSLRNSRVPCRDTSVQCITAGRSGLLENGPPRRARLLHRFDLGQCVLGVV